nr:MAG TPA: tail protein [Caudoviricetes sp.]
MDAKNVKIVFTSNGKEMAFGKHSAYKIRSIQGLETSDITLTATENAGIDGATVTNRRLGPRHIDIVGGIPSGDREVYRENLVRFFNPANEGTAIIEYCGRKRKVGYLIENVDFGTLDSVYKIPEFTVSLYCENPMLLSTSSYGRNIAAFIPQFSLPFKCTVEKKQIMGYQKISQSILIANDGDKAVGAEFVVTATRGEVDSPTIRNETTGQYIKVMRKLFMGDTLQISTIPRQKEILINGSNAITDMDRMSDLSLCIIPGDNVVEYDAEDGMTNMDVRLYYTPEYLGV